jgi:diguanylate cyclase (GGDEF)-like protein
VIAGERMRVVLEKTPFTVDGEQLKITGSIGYANYPDHGIDMNELISRADKALLMSKVKGKNRSTVFAEP